MGVIFFFSSRRRHTSGALVTGVQTCALPICTVLEETPCENSQFFKDAKKPNWGSYADFAWLPNGLAFFRVPDHADVDAVIALGCALPTVLRGFDRCGPVRIGQSVVVQGAGPIGLAAVLVSSLMGARDVVAVDVHANRQIGRAQV